MKLPTIASVTGEPRARIGRYGGIADRLFAPDVVYGLVPSLLVVAALALLVGGVAFLPAHPLALVALWAGIMGLLVALPLALIVAVGEVLIAFER